MKNFNLILLLVFLVACNNQSSSDEIREAAEESFETEQASSGSTQNGLCYVDQYAPDEESINRKLDIIIVPDTSTSLKEERGDIANGFDHFINSLPDQIDYRVGVILGHSGKSPKSGKLFQRNDEPFVLNSQEMNSEDIISALHQKLKSPAGDGFSDGGEMGLYSLNVALTENIEQLQQDGVFREDAALAIVFIADEQDVCFEYPEHIQSVPDKQNKENKARDKYCRDENGNYIITPQVVLNKIKEVNGQKPLTLGAVIYNNAETMPINGENEIGYGYKEIVELAGGITIDLATGNYGDGLERLGRLAQASVQPENEFNLKTSPVDLSSIQVTVNGESVGYEYISEQNQIKLNEERDAFSVARIEYCQKEEEPMIATKVIAGGFHSCAIYLNGKAKCWGQNNSGQLGYNNNDTYGDNEHVSSLAFLNIDEKIIDMSAGLFHTCAILESGKVLCWGANDKGQLGLGHANNTFLENSTKMNLGENALRIYSGTRYNCALLESKKIKCWGENTSGQLGLGHPNNIGDNEDYTTFDYTPVGSTIQQMDISTISNHSCAALTNGDVKCWGLNNFGQLGYGHTDNVGDSTPITDIDGISFGNKVLQLATGFSHTCAIEEGQKARCWGSNNLGQLGLGYVDTIGDNEAANSGPQVDLSGDGSDSFKMVATGNNHTCVLGLNNKIYCWGFNTYGNTGQASTGHIGDNEDISVSNTFVNIDSEFSQISGGVNHSCALEKDKGEIICWGHNNFGQLGIASTETIGDDELPTQFVQLQE